MMRLFNIIEMVGVVIESIVILGAGIAVIAFGLLFNVLLFVVLGGVCVIAAFMYLVEEIIWLVKYEKYCRLDVNEDKALEEAA